MTFASLTSPRTQSNVVTFQAKLPDDLTFAEYADLIENARVLVEVSRSGLPHEGESRLSYLSLAPDPTILRSQYGSDFLVVLSVVGSVAGTGGLVAATLFVLSKGLKVLADAGYRNEERLALKDERISRRRRQRDYAEELKLVTDEITQSAGTDMESPFRELHEEMLDQLVDPLVRAELADVLQSEVPDALLVALATLAQYGVEITVEEG